MPILNIYVLLCNVERNLRTLLYANTKCRGLNVWCALFTLTIPISWGKLVEIFDHQSCSNYLIVQVSSVSKSFRHVNITYIVIGGYEWLQRSSGKNGLKLFRGHRNFLVFAFVPYVYLTISSGSQRIRGYLPTLRCHWTILLSASPCKNYYITIMHRSALDSLQWTRLLK